MIKNECILNYLKNDFDKIISLTISNFDISEILKPKDWEHSKNKYIKKVKDMYEKQTEELNCVCIFDDLIASQHPQGNSFKELIDIVSYNIKLAKENIHKLYPMLESRVNNIIRCIFTSGDAATNGNNCDYRNHIAELFVFNYFCESRDTYTINAIEKSLGNKKMADFELIHKDNYNLLVEVMSMQNIQCNDHTSETLSKYITEKIKQKYQNKIGNNTRDDLYIMPIVNYGVIPFKINIDFKYALPLMTIVKRTKDGQSAAYLEEHNSIIK